ncbi:hypothetical protein GW937_01995 [Candidatus Kaiserbacteria bacterium]|nr:hypothetical protein [Candidatus Kaiserbacteria bacterium]
MTAFNEVMTAEQKADNAILLAKEEATAAVASAIENRRITLESTETELKKIEQQELGKHSQHIEDLLEKISADATAQVMAMRQRFETHKAALLALLKEEFNK